MRKEVIGDCELYLGDCRDILPTLGKVDAVVTDPPYGIGENSKKNATRGKPRYGKGNGVCLPTDYGEFDWDTAPSQELIDFIREISDYQIIFGGNYFSLPPTSCWLIWDKVNGNSDFADCEMAWTNLKIAVRKISWMWNGMLRDGSDIRRHPTQKPLGVMKWAIGWLPKTIGTICDPFMGSGTTGHACVERGLKFIGIEKDERYFDIACRRLEKAERQPDMLVWSKKHYQEVLSL